MTVSPRTRVLLFVDNLDQGGTQRQSVALANALLDDAEFQIYFGCLHGGGPLREILRVPGDRFLEYRLHRFYSPGGLRQMARLARDIRRLDIRVVHTMDFYANVMGVGTAAWLPNVKLMVSRRYEQLSSLRRHWIGERIAYRAADAVLLNSQRIADDLVRRGAISAGKVHVVRNGIDLAQYAGPGAQIQSGPEVESRCRVGVVARLSPDKGLITMLEAGAIVARQWPTLELVFVGDGELRNELSHRARALGLAGQLEITGMVEDVRPWVRGLSVAVLPSLREGLPNALLEYMALGAPVVASAVGAVPEVLRDGVDGVLVPPGDPQALADAINGLLRNESRRKALGQAARKRVEEYRLEHAVNAVRSLYRSLSQRARAGKGTTMQAAEASGHVRHLR